MESVGLQYLAQYKVVLCKEHHFCITAKNLKRHLWDLHAAKGRLVQDAMDEIEPLELAPPTEVVSPQAGGAPIEGLEVKEFFRCTLANCNREVTACSQAREKVVKHISKRHKIGLKKKVKPIEGMIEVVSMQSFFQHPLHQWFEVRPTASNPPCPPSNDRIRQAMDTTYQQSQRKWEEQFDKLDPDLELYETQTPPWLSNTGIAPFLESLPVEKQTLTDLLKPIASNEESVKSSIEVLIGQCVLERMQHLRRRTRPGTSRYTVNRVTLRYMNSFRPDCMQTVPFTGVQEEATLGKYAGLWSLLLVFLTRVFPEPDHCLYSRLFHRHQDLFTRVQHLIDSAEGLHAVNVSHLSFADCLHTGNDGDDLDEEDESLQLHARAFRKAVDRLSTGLVCQLHTQDAFSLPVVAYSACQALHQNGAWIMASEFRPFLSGMIHCIQLFLLGHCLYLHQRQDPQPRLQDFVKEQCQLYLVNNTPTSIAELSHWRLVCRTASNDSTRFPVTTLSDDSMQINHAHLELRVDCWREGLQQMFRQASEILAEDLFFGLTGFQRFPVSSLRDNPAEKSPGWSFLKDQRNRLDAVQDGLFKQLHTDAELRHRFFNPVLSEDSPDLSYQLSPNRMAIGDYLDRHQQFLQLIAILIYMTAGLPPRRKELLGLSWCNQETPRNVHISHGLLAVVSGYHKSSWRVGFRPIARFLPAQLGDLIVHYLIHMPSLLHFFHDCMQLSIPRGFLFFSDSRIWSPDSFSSYIKKHTARLLGVQLSPQSWRHIAIALDRRFLQGLSCRLYGIVPQQKLPDDSSDSGLEEVGLSQDLPVRTASNVHHTQAAHTVDTNRSHYGNTFSLTDGLNDSLLRDFCDLSKSWHQLCHMQTPFQTASSQKRPVSVSAEQPSTWKRSALGSRLEVRSQLSVWPAIEAGLQRLFGADAAPRDRMQRDALRLLARSLPETIIVMPTGSGKTILYIVLSLLPTSQVTVVIIPLVALRQDLFRRCQEWKVPFWHFNAMDHMEKRLYAVPGLVFVDVDIAVSPGFLGFLRRLYQASRLDRLVLDEAHLVLTASDYRENLGLLAILRQVKCPFVCLTATLPPIAELDLQQSLFMTHPAIHRSSSDRPNLKYCVQSLPAPRRSASSISADQQLIDATIDLCQQEYAQWSLAEKKIARILCYVRQKALGIQLAAEVQGGFYHAGLPDAEKQKIMTAWSAPAGCPILVATAALSEGLDYPSIRHVIHIDAPQGFVEYGQETGRAGRDGLHATCTVILPSRWTVDWGNRYRNDFLIEDIRQMTLFLTSKTCLRKLLTSFLDGPIQGQNGVACTELPDAVRTLCMNCVRQSPVVLGQESRVVSIPSRPLSHAGSTSPARSSVTPSRLDSDESVHGGSGLQEASGPSTETTAFDNAAHSARLDIMVKAEALALYEQRLATWGRSCILCSYLRRERVPFPHTDCMQHRHTDSMTHLRRSIRFEPKTGCYRCGQPVFICQQKGQAGCQYPWLVFHSCWTAITQDHPNSFELIRHFGGPSLTKDHTEKYPAYLKWLGCSHHMFGRPTGSNAARMAHYWIDRLESICARRSSMEKTVTASNSHTTR